MVAHTMEVVIPLPKCKFCIFTHLFINVHTSNSSSEINVRLETSRKVVTLLTKVCKPDNIGPKAGRWRDAPKIRLRHLNYGPGDVCCISAGLNIRLMFGCDRRLGFPA